MTLCSASATVDLIDVVDVAGREHHQVVWCTLKEGHKESHHGGVYWVEYEEGDND